MSVNIVTYTGKTRTAQHDAMTYDAAIGQSGVFYGCEITAAGNTLTVGGGFGIIKGRVFQIEEESITVPLESSGTANKMLVLTLDLSNSSEPLALSVQNSSYELTQDNDANFDAGIYQIRLATFKVTSVEITDVYMTYDRVHGGVSAVDVADTSLNQYVDNGIYYFRHDFAPSDAPAGINGWLIVLGGRTAKKQIWLREGSENTQADTCVRSFAAGVWTSWRRLTSANEMYYMPGDQATFYISNGGYLTSGKTYIGTLIPLPKPVHSSVTSVTVVNNNNTITIRQNGAYLATDAKISTFQPTCFVRTNGLQLNLNKASGFGGTNNDSCSIVGYITVKFN